MNYEEARRVLAGEKQEHLLCFWESLTPAQKAALLGDISTVDWSLIRGLAGADGESTTHFKAHEMAAPKTYSLPTSEQGQLNRKRYRQIGEQLLRDGAVAALTVAGGQGTRLGFTGPKGMFPITPVKAKTLFQHFAESILASIRRYQCDIKWYLMTSPANHNDTIAFFEKHEFFGLDRSAVHFFEQGTMPALSAEGKVLLSERHRLALAPDGHGGTLRALKRAGYLEEMQANGIRTISYFQVDNPLITPLDPAFIGLVHSEKSEAGSKVVPKAYDDEKVGVFVNAAGALRVVEYTHLPEELATKRNGDGTRTFDAANIAAHLFDVDFCLRAMSADADLRMPWHRAHKQVPHIDPNTGQQVEPQSPNACKMEQFIFDAIPIAANPILYEVNRWEEFSPVKNAKGKDSPHTARADMSAKAAKWLSRCQLDWLKTKALEDLPIEISPLFALDAEELKSRMAGQPDPDPAESLYWGP